MILAPRELPPEPASEALLRLIKTAREVCSPIDVPNRREAKKVRGDRIRTLNLALHHLDERLDGRAVEDLIRRVMREDLKRLQGRENDELEKYRWDDF